MTRKFSRIRNINTILFPRKDKYILCIISQKYNNIKILTSLKFSLFLFNYIPFFFHLRQCQRLSIGYWSVLTMAHIGTARTAHVQTDVLLNKLVWDLWLVTAGWQWSFTGSKPVSFELLITGFSQTGRMIMVLRLLRLESILLDLLLSREVVGLTLISRVLRDQVGAGTWCHERTLSSAGREELRAEGSGLLSCCVDRGETTLLESWLAVAVVITLQTERHSRGSGRCQFWSVHWSDVHMKLWSAPASFAVKILRATYNATISEVRRKGKHGSVRLFLIFFLYFLLDGSPWMWWGSRQGYFPSLL